MKHLGSTFIEPPIFDLSGSYEDSSPCTPLIFLLSAGEDPMTSLIKLAEDKGIAANKISRISLGQGQVSIG